MTMHMQGSSCVLLGLLSLLVVVSGGWWSDDTNADADAVVEREQEKLDELLERYLTLKERLQTAIDIHDDGEAIASNGIWTLDRRAGKNKGCELNYFPCAPWPAGSVQCVRDYLVCDGSADCRNGADEAPETCGRTVPFLNAVVMPTVVTKDICRTVPTEKLEDQKPFGWAINAANIIPWFPSRPRLTWKYMIHIETPTGTLEAEFETGAVYDYATGAIYTDFNANHFLTGPCWLDFSNRKAFVYICELQRPRDIRPDRVCFVSVSTLAIDLVE